MIPSLKIGRAFGISIYVHWTFLLLFGLLLLASGLAIYPALMIAAVFSCVVLHELGHALTARRFGIPTRDITLYPIGGVARLERMSERPREEFLIAIGGPAVNVVLAGLFATLMTLTGQPLPEWSYQSLVLTGNLLHDLTVVNVVLVLFNMLPAFPMDGGRVLRALLAARLGHLRATEIAVGLSGPMALFFAFSGFLSLARVVDWGNPMLILVAAFVYFAGQQELAVVRQRAWMRRLAPIPVMQPDEEIPSVVPVDEEPAVPLVWDPRLRTWVVWRRVPPAPSSWS
jgi:Zn-dependent protease